MSRLASLVSRIGAQTQDLLGGTMKLPPEAGRFLLGINLGGGPLHIQGQRWQGHEEALASGMLLPGVSIAQTHIVPNPYADKGVRQMLNSVVFRNQALDLSLPLPSGDVDIYLWIMENFRSDWHSLNLTLNGRPAAQALGKFPLGTWRREGPFATSVGAQPLALCLSTDQPGVDAHLVGVSVFGLDRTHPRGV